MRSAWLLIIYLYVKEYIGIVREQIVYLNVEMAISIFIVFKVI